MENPGQRASSRIIVEIWIFDDRSISVNACPYYIAQIRLRDPPIRIFHMFFTTSENAMLNEPKAGL